jgi:hypothetical protein
MISQAPATRSTLRSKSARVGYPLMMAAGALVAACSSSPMDESTGSTAAAVTASGVLDNADLSLAVSATDLWGSSLPYSNGQIEFVPSACGSAVNLANFISAGTVSLPTAVISTGNFICPTYTASITALSIPSLLGKAPFGGTQACPNNESGTPGSLALTPAGLQATVALTGNLHLMAGTGGYNACPSGDVQITSGTVTLTLAWNASTQQFTATTASNLVYNAANCWGGVCNGIISSNVGDLNAKLSTQLSTALNAALSSPGTAPGIANALYGALAAEWNVMNGVSIGSPDAASVVPGTVAYSAASGGEFTFEVTHNTPPGAPGCAPTSTCSSEFFPASGPTNPAGFQTDETVSVACQTQPTVVQQNVNGTWVTLKNFVASASYPTSVTQDVYVIGGQSAQGGTSSGSAVGSAQAIRACLTTTGGTTCDAPTNVTISDCCVPEVCETGSCGTQSDGCGGTITCGSCGTGEVCVAGMCQDSGPQGACEAGGGTWADGRCIKVPIKCGGKLPACQ